MKEDSRFLTRAWPDRGPGLEAGLRSVVLMTQLREVRLGPPVAREVAPAACFTGRAGALLRNADLVSSAGTVRSEQGGMIKSLVSEIKDVFDQ